MFKLFIKGEIWWLCTVTIGQKGPKLNSSQVYCSRLYGILLLQLLLEFHKILPFIFFFNLSKLLGMQPIFEQLSKLHPSCKTYFNMLKIPKLKSMLNNLVKTLVYKNWNANLSRFLTPLWESSQTTLGFLQPKHPHWDSARKNVFVR